MNPLLSLIVPTRERARTLAFTLATALDQAREDYEVVVSDNASTDDTEAVVRAIGDPRLRYVNTGRRLSMCDNYEFALENARGDYVIIIGDDDAVMPSGIDLLLPRLEALAEPTIHLWPLHIYDWPTESQGAQPYYLAPQRGPETVIELKSAARSVMRMGGWKYYELPSPYHSAVPRALLNDLRERTGRVFHSTQPDVFTAMALPAFADRAIRLGRTVTLHGRSGQSNGRDFTRANRPNIDRFIREYGGYRFHPTLFEGTSATAKMIPDAILMAKDMFPEVYGDVDFGYAAMWAYVCRLRFASHGHVIRNAYNIRRAHPFSVARFLGYSAVHEAALVRRGLLNQVQRPARFRGDVPGNIHDFVRLLATENADGAADRP